MSGKKSLKKGVKDWRGKNFKAVICRLACGSVVYHLWRQRNDEKFGNMSISEEKMVQMISWEVRTRIMCKGKIEKKWRKCGCVLIGISPFVY